MAGTQFAPIPAGMLGSLLRAPTAHDREAGASTFMWLFVLVIFVLGMWTTWTGISTAVADRGERQSLCLKVADSPAAKAQMGC